MSQSLVTMAMNPPIAVVELNRKEKRNALNIALRDELEACLERLESDDRIKAVVLTGGEECFSAGFDLKELVETDLRAVMHRGVEFTERTYFFKKPLVTAVGGYAFAGGFDLALSGDLIVATPGAKFGRPEVRWGINPLMTKLWLRVGMPRALQFSTTGAPINAEDALAIGLVDRLAAPGTLLRTAESEALKMCAPPLAALVAVKRAARTVPFMDVRRAIEYEFGLSAEILADGAVRTTLLDYARSVGVLQK